MTFYIHIFYKQLRFQFWKYNLNERKKNRKAIILDIWNKEQVCISFISQHNTKTFHFIKKNPLGNYTKLI